MKTQIWISMALALFACSCNAEEWHPRTAAELREIRIQCLKDHPLSDEQLGKMQQLEFPNEMAIVGYILCTALRSKIFDEPFGYKPERVVKQFKMDLDESEALTIAKECAEPIVSNNWLQYRAYDGNQCMMESKIGARVRDYIRPRHEEAIAAAEAKKA